jgi:hypothetical protein
MSAFDDAAFDRKAWPAGFRAAMFAREGCSPWLAAAIRRRSIAQTSPAP